MEFTINSDRLIKILLALTFVVVVFNSYQLSGATGSPTGFSVARAEVIPTGTPKIYGNELGVSYDDVSPNDPYKADLTIGKLKQLDKTIDLSGANLERYIDILYNMNGGISCEYCCGAQSVIASDGRAACGCAHSSSMRGLTKYLITEHGNEYTDEEILEEAGKWKTLFFPTQMQAKAKLLEEKGIEFNYINLASNNNRGIEKGVSGGMVGGC